MLVFSILLVLNIQYEIPESCKDLAKREGYPLVMTEQEEAYARNRIKSANQNDPLVKKCQKAIEAIDRMKKQKI